MDKKASLKRENLKVLIVASEAAPYAKSGGLGDVAGVLPKELQKIGVDARLIFPKYKHVRERYVQDAEYISSIEVLLGWRRQSASIFKLKDIDAYMIENDYYFNRDGFYGYGDDYERFAFFCKAAIECLPTLNFLPDVIHFNDWQTGLGCIYLKDFYNRFTCFAGIKTLFTIHNLQYQGIFGREILGNIDINDGYFVSDKIEFHGRVSFIKAGLTYADAISTVSKTYAREIQTGSYGYGMDGMLRAREANLFGILNGIDYDVYNPETDPRIFASFNVDTVAEGKAANKAGLQRYLNLPQNPETPLIAMVSRLVDQKGCDILAGAIHELMRRDVQFVVLGTGDGRYEYMFKDLAYRYPEKLSANICFNEDLAQKIYAAADIFIMPSLFEPCGLGQIIAMRYGTIPVARRTGGLNDTVHHFSRYNKTGNGFLFEDYLTSGLLWAINEALSVFYDKEDWKYIVKNAMREDYSWKASAEKYAELYLSLKNM